MDFFLRKIFFFVNGRREDELVIYCWINGSPLSVLPQGFSSLKSDQLLVRRLNNDKSVRFYLFCQCLVLRGFKETDETNQPT